jgi:zona occludens toxin
MIELYEGVPGSGKSYHAICEKFLPWVKQGRRLYIAVDGIYLDRLSLFTGIELVYPRTTDHDLERLRRSPPGLSPCRAWLSRHHRRSADRLSVHAEGRTGLLRWLETHRHYGVDILLMSQDFRQMSQGVTRLIEATVKFRKLAFVGLSKKYQGKVRGNPEDNEVIRAFVGTYSPAIYAYYSSYASAAIREEKRSHTVFKSARVAIGIAAGLFAIGLMVWRPWSSLSSTKPMPASTGVSVRSELASASISIGAGQSAESVWCVCPIDSEPTTSEAHRAHSRRGRNESEPSRLALSLGQRRDPDGRADYWTVWGLGLGSL